MPLLGMIRMPLLRIDSMSAIATCATNAIASMYLTTEISIITNNKATQKNDPFGKSKGWWCVWSEHPSPIETSHSSLSSHKNKGPFTGSISFQSHWVDSVMAVASGLIKSEIYIRKWLNLTSVAATDRHRCYDSISETGVKWLSFNSGPVLFRSSLLCC